MSKEQLECEGHEWDYWDYTLHFHLERIISGTVFTRLHQCHSINELSGRLHTLLYNIIVLGVLEAPDVLFKYFNIVNLSVTHFHILLWNLLG